MYKISLVLFFLSFSLWADWSEKASQALEPYWKGARVEVQVLENTSDIPEAATLSLRGTDAYIGLVSIQWEWLEKGRPKSKYGMVKVSVFQKVAVAKEALVHGQSLEPKSIDFQERELSGLHQLGYFLVPEELKLRRSIGYVAKGTVFTRRNTTGALWVEAGQRVQLLQSTGALQISAEMECLEMGSEGDWVRVRHPKTRRVVRAKVIGLGQVTVL